MASNDRQPRAVTIALAATAVMWVATYNALLVGSFFIGELLFGIVVLCPLLGGAVVVRSGGTISAAARMGAICGGLNVLLIGSVVGGQSPATMAAEGMAWAIGLLVATVLLGTLGAWIGARMRPCAQDADWRSWFFRAVMAVVFLMIVSGGLVTGLEAGLAVPDWPNSYGHNMLLYPLSAMVDSTNEGVFFEHAHRLTGMFTGLAAILAMVLGWRWSRSPLVRGLVTVAFLLVCLQGLLGGLRVTGNLTLSDDPGAMDPSTALGLVHGIVAQVIFALYVLIACATSPTWSAPAGSGVPRGERRIWWMLLAAMILQLGLGAAYRHLSRDPAMAEHASHPLMAHVVMAIVVLVMAVVAGLRLMKRHRETAPLYAWGHTVLVLVGIQVMLGAGALVAVILARDAAAPPLYEIALTTGHQANGALLLGAALAALGWVVHRSGAAPTME